jgi:GNAT superfamily N-acetyltransferase
METRAQHPLTFTKGEFSISTDRDKLDLGFIHGFLSGEAYWSRNIPLETVRTSVENSLNFGLYHGERQIGYARVITDYATIAYLGDVFVNSEYRGKGLSKWLMQQVTDHPDLQGLRRWLLLTRDAHELYKKFGWQPIQSPDRYMERFNPDVYVTN